MNFEAIVGLFRRRPHWWDGSIRGFNLQKCVCSYGIVQYTYLFSQKGLNKCGYKLLSGTVPVLGLVRRAFCPFSLTPSSSSGLLTTAVD